MRPFLISIRRFLVLACCTVFLQAGAAWAEGLRAGAAQVDITPPIGLRMWGFAGRTSPSIGAWDPLYARVLVLEAGGTRLGIVILDLGRTFGPPSLSRLRASTRNDVDHLLVAAIHTHSAPYISDEYPNGTPAWETADLQKIAAAVHDASSHLVDARIGVGYGQAYIGHNRLHRNPDGTVSWFERDPTRLPTAPVDPTVAVLRVDTAEGKPLAILVNYACHPVIFGSDNLKYSADWPGVMDRVVSNAFESLPVAFFVQGGDGDINPYYAVTRIQQDAVRDRDWTGKRLGKEAIRVAKTIRTDAAPGAQIQFARDMLTFHIRWNPQKWQAMRMGLVRAGVETASAPTVIHAPVTTILIDKQIAIIAMPGEPFVAYQKSLRDRCPVPDCFLMGYAGGYYGYLPTIDAAGWGGYGAADSATWLEVGAGDRMLDHGLIRIDQMLGRFRVPSDFTNPPAVTREGATP